MTLWTPSHLSSVTLMGWYRTVDPAGVAAIGADITVVSGAVTTWLDRSPLNVTLTKSGSGTITYSGNALGFGIAGIVADGNSAFHSANGIAYPVNSVVGAFVIANVDSSTPAFQRLVSLIPTGASDVFTGAVPIVINPVDTTQQIAYIYNLNTSGKIPVTLGVPSLFEGYPISDTQAVIALNAGTPGTAEPVPALSFNQLGVLEAAQGGGGFLQAAVAEIVLVAGVLSSDEQAKLEGYIAWNNGQQALLPAGHPYKSGAPLSGTTWSDTDKYSGIALSGGNLTATGDGAITFEAGRSTASQTGARYFEVLVVAMPPEATDLSPVGIDTGAGAITTNFIGSTTTSFAFRPADGVLFTNSSPYGVATSRAFVNPGDRIMVAFDTATGELYGGVNGVWGVDLSGLPQAPSTRTHPIAIPTGTAMFAAYTLSGVTSYTGCFTAASQVYAAPTGFTAFDDGTGGGAGPPTGRIFDATTGLRPTSWTIARGTSATFFNSLGVMATAAANTERLDYLYVGAVWSLGGLLVEPTETTSSPTARTWPTGAWNVTLSLDAAAAPDGNMTADVITETTVWDEHLCSHPAGCNSGIPVRYGIFIKDDGAAFALVRIYDYTGTGYNTYFDFSTGEISSADAGISVESVTNVGNGWYRIIVVYNPVGTGLNLIVGPTQGDGQESYPGDGTSGIIAWGGSFTTSGPMGLAHPEHRVGGHDDAGRRRLFLQAGGHCHGTHLHV